MDFIKFSVVGSFIGILEDPTSVPDVQGVYAVLPSGPDMPEFLEKGTGGYFKGKNPNVPLTVLRRNWVYEAPILYIGKAGGSGLRATLRSRLFSFAQFGIGKRVSHRGGRLIWQIPCAQLLTVICMPTKQSPREVKRQLLLDFVSEYTRLPFANLRR